jgi:hypothetical protein
MCYVTDTEKEALAAVDAGYGMVFLIDKKQARGKAKQGYVIIHNYKEVEEQTVRKDATGKEAQPAKA